jgi:hypothetical protein
MKQRSESKETDQEKVMTGMADKAMRNYDQFVRTGLKIQEEASRCWTSLFTQGASAQDWQRPASAFASIANGVLPKAQRRMQEVLELTEKNTRLNVELFRKAAEAMQTVGIGERQTKWMDFWTSSLEAARSNADTVMQIGTSMFDTWFDVVQKNTEAPMREAKGS